VAVGARKQASEREAVGAGDQVVLAAGSAAVDYGSIRSYGSHERAHGGGVADGTLGSFVSFPRFFATFSGRRSGHRW
jgi:hypothetical protein